MQIQIIPVTPFEQNCSLLICEETGKAALVDPGGDADQILAAVEQSGAQLEKIFVTHGHFDHAGAVACLLRQKQVPVEGPHEEDRFLLDTLPQWCQQLGFPPCESFLPNRWLQDGDQIRFGAQVLDVLHCPGHTPGHVVLVHRADRVAIVGDVIFQGAIGRTDFPRGDHATLIASITEKLWSLDDDVTLFPGHGPTTTVGDERRYNPFVSGKHG